MFLKSFFQSEQLAFFLFFEVSFAIEKCHLLDDNGNVCQFSNDFIFPGSITFRLGNGIKQFSTFLNQHPLLFVDAVDIQCQLLNFFLFLLCHRV